MTLSVATRPSLPNASGAVRFEHFSAWFEGAPALVNVSLEIQPRSITAIIGPSGAGKSTLLRAINRLDEGLPGARRSGVVRVGDEDIFSPWTDLSRLRQRVGMVFQRSNPFPRSIFENVAYGPRLTGRAQGRALDDLVEQSLRRATLWEEVRERLDAPAHQLSAGQQQRLCVARALANSPEVLLLDEPTSALDPQATLHVEELLYELQRDLTIIIVTHNLQQAARLSRRTALLVDGVLIEEGASERLFTRPADSRTEAFITGRFG